MKTRIAALLIAVSAPTAALADREAQVRALYEQFGQEQRVFLACTLLEPATHGFLRQAVGEMVEDAEAILREARFSRTLIAELTEATRPQALIPAPETPVGEVTALCAAAPDWARRFERMSFIILPDALESLLAE